jgi:hypothetical protein
MITVRALTRERLTIDDAMDALGVADPSALGWSQALADNYRREVGPNGYLRKQKFADLRKSLRKEVEDIRRLASRMEQKTDDLWDAIHYVRSRRPVQDGERFRRWEIITALRHHADEIEGLMKLSWPQGGAMDVRKAVYGPPKVRLVWKCLQVFFCYGKADEISAKRESRFGDYVKAVYEIATGQDSEGRGVGLDKIINEVAREWRQGRKRAAQKIFHNPYKNS